VSSLSVYGPTAGPTHRETDEPNPGSTYGRSKLVAEQGIGAYASEAFQVVILRPAGVYGPVRFGCGSRSAAFIDQGVIRISRGEPLLVTLANDPVDEFLYIKDLARAILAAATLPLQHSTTVVNIGTGHVSTVAELQDALHSLDAKADIHIKVQGGENGARNLVPLDTRIAAELLGFRAAFGLRTGVLDHQKEYAL
jgi:nucleoside-diphosphate-sugar epimerase